MPDRGPICCLLGACCPPVAQRNAIADELTKHGMDLAAAHRASVILAPRIKKAHKAALSEFEKNLLSGDTHRRTEGT